MERKLGRFSYGTGEQAESGNGENLSGQKATFHPGKNIPEKKRTGGSEKEHNTDEHANITHPVNKKCFLGSIRC